mgnify:CR=1 FL=1
MSRSNLHLKLKAITGKSAIDFIHKIRFNRACQLLKEGKYTVSEISFMVGYNTPSYFSARFKKYIGCLPTEYGKPVMYVSFMEYYYEDVFFFRPFLLILVHSLLVSCSRTGTPGFTIAREDSLRYEGKTVELFRMTNRNGMTVKVTNYGLL